MIDEVVDHLRHRGDRELPGGVGPRRAVDRAEDDLPDLAALPGPRARGRWPRRARPRHAARRPPGRRPEGLRGPRGRGRLRGDARARAAGAALGAGPQVARAPLRDGLPARGHRAACLLPARPAGGVPARGLRHVQRHEGRHPRGDRRLPVQPRGPGRGGRGGGRDRAIDLLAGADTSGAPDTARRRAAGTTTATTATSTTRRTSAPRVCRPPRRRRTSPTPRPARTARPRSRAQPASNADDPYAGVGRNALCPCGSGKKYKKCHGAPGGPTGLTARPAG